MQRQILLLIVLAVLTGACGGSAASPMRAHPGDTEARRDLDRLAALSQQADITALCEHGTANCADTAKSMDASLSAPDTAPVVVGSRDVPDNGNAQGGRALKVCGVDGQGRAYRNEILFFGTEGDFTAVEALFWIIGFADNNEVTATSSPGPEWDSCPPGSD
jgi:hypothetical protein